VVTAGVNPGDTLVTDGQDKLQSGSKIEPVTTPRRTLRAATKAVSQSQELQVHESVSIIYFRPVATTLFDGGRAAGRVVAFLQLPVSALPEVDYPTIQVVTFYPGAIPT